MFALTYFSVLLNYFCLVMAMGVDTHSCMLVKHDYSHG